MMEPNPNQVITRLMLTREHEALRISILSIARKMSTLDRVRHPDNAYSLEATDFDCMFGLRRRLELRLDYIQHLLDSGAFDN
jgi:hypothetical protein